MASSALPSDFGVDQASSLLALALSEPARAAEEARLVLDAGPPDLVASIAHQTLGIVAREAGRLPEALAELATAARRARRGGSDARQADVLATLGVTLATAGRTRAGLRRLDAALALAPGPEVGRVRMRRAFVLLTLGRAAPALADLDQALAEVRACGDRLWEARSLLNRSWAHMLLGRPSAAAADAEASHALFVELGQLQEVAHALHNRSSAAFDIGDLPAALALIDQAEAAYRAVGEVPPELESVRCPVLLAAQLVPEAVAETDRALARKDLTPRQRPDLLVVAAAAALAAGEPAAASKLAGSARSEYAAQLRHRGAGRAGFLVAQSEVAAGRADPALARSVARLAGRLDAEHSPDAAVAHLLAARLALAVGTPRTALPELEAAARGRTGVSPLERSTGWLATALAHQARNDDRGVLKACRRGLDEVDSYRETFGDLTLRALSTAHGRELSALALGRAAATGNARRLLAWSERTRASALATPPALPHEDPELADAIGAARRADRQLTASDGDPSAGTAARRERDRVEAEIRRRYRRLRGEGTAPAPLDVAAIVEAIGEDTLLSLVDVGGVLHAVLVHAGRVTAHEVGPTAAAAAEAEFARFTLRRAAYGRPPALAPVGERLQATVLGPVAGRLTGRIVVVPPAGLHTLPWGLLPALAPAQLSIAPSARLWLRARSRQAAGPVVFAAGPDLSSDQAEVAAQASRYAAACTLSGPAATAQTVAAALDGSALAHLAAHGDFRADAPMFSSVRLHDGPLFLHDLDRLATPPHTVVLSACDVGAMTAVGMDEGLGLVTGLLGLGTSAVLASTVPVNDLATLAVMDHLHAALAAGASLPAAWLSMRRNGEADPLLAATAAAFTAWGC